MSASPRELLLTNVYHPDHLRIGPWALERVDHQYAELVRRPDATQGWEGDDRLCVYLDGANRVWVIMRLEHDLEYRPALMSEVDENLNTFIYRAVKWLVAHDIRRGFDVLKSVRETNEKVDADRAKARTEWSEQVGEKLTWAARRDDL